MGSRPVSASVMAELSRYVSELDIGQEKLFSDNFSHKLWRKICKKAGLTDLKFHLVIASWILLAVTGIAVAAYVIIAP